MAKKRVLVAVGNGPWRERLRAILRRKLCDVSTTTDGFESMEVLRNHQFEIVIADESLKGTGPLELVFTLKDIQDVMPVVLVTGLKIEKYANAWEHCNVFFAGTRQAVLGKIDDAIKAASESRAHTFSKGSA